MNRLNGGRSHINCSYSSVYKEVEPGIVYLYCRNDDDNDDDDDDDELVVCFVCFNEKAQTKV